MPLKKLAGKTVIRPAAGDELVKDLQRALDIVGCQCQARLWNLSKAVRTRSLEEEPQRHDRLAEHVLRIVYQELVGCLASTDVRLEPRRS